MNCVYLESLGTMVYSNVSFMVELKEQILLSKIGNMLPYQNFDYISILLFAGPDSDFA